MASPEAAVVRDLVHRLIAHPQAERSVDTRGHVRASSLETADFSGFRDVVQSTKDELNLVEAVAELRSLILPRSQLGDQGLITLMRAFKEGSRRASSLKYLDLTDNNITEKGFEALTEALETNFLSGLESLIVAQNEIGENGANLLAKVLRTGHFASLRGLDMSYCNVGSMGMVSIADSLQSGNFSALRIQNLDFSANGIGERALVPLIRAMVMGRLPELRFLSLSGNELGEEGTGALATVLKARSHLPKLTHLLLSLCYARDALVPIFQSLQGVPSLEVLDVSGNHMGDRGSVALAIALRTGALSNLWHLNLSQCDIGAQQVDFIMKAVRVGEVFGLKHLDLSYNNLNSNSAASLSLTEDGVFAIVSLIRNGFLSRLEYLDLSHCSITDVGLIDLAGSMTAGKLPVLQHFLFKGNEIRSPKAIKALVRALESGNLSFLQEIELGQNSVGEDATMALASALTVSSAQGPLVEMLKNRLMMTQKSMAAEGRTVGDEVKKVWRNRSFTSLGVIKPVEEQLPTGEKLYNRFLERQYSNRLSPVVDEEIAGRPSNSKFFFNFLFVLAWLVAIVISKRL
ncbi:unnamed protein product [Calypogeia fissa]